MRVYVHVLWMLVTALKWVTDFYTAAIIETRKAAKSKVSAANPLPLPPYLDRWLWDNSNDKAVIIGKQTSWGTQQRRPDFEKDKEKDDDFKAKEYLFWALHKYFDA